MITAQQILKEVDETCSEYLEMMTLEEKFILIRNALAQKLVYEIALKDHYKKCFESSLFSNNFSQTEPKKNSELL